MKKTNEIDKLTLSNDYVNYCILENIIKDKETSAIPAFIDLIELVHPEKIDIMLSRHGIPKTSKTKNWADFMLNQKKTSMSLYRSLLKLIKEIKPENTTVTFLTENGKNKLYFTETIIS